MKGLPHKDLNWCQISMRVLEYTGHAFIYKSETMIKVREKLKSSTSAYFTISF